MSTVRITVVRKRQPVTVTLENSTIELEFEQANRFGKSIPPRLLLHTDTVSACITLHSGVERTEIRRLARTLRNQKPPDINMDGPVMAIHIVTPGLGWPEEHFAGSVSTFNCRPRKDWTFMDSARPVESDHPLSCQPPDTLSFENSAAICKPVRIHYVSIVGVEQRGGVVRIVVNPESTELLGFAMIHVSDEATASRLAVDLRAHRVQRIQPNQTVRRVLLVPRALRTSVYQNWLIHSGVVDLSDSSWDINGRLLWLARNLRPEDVAYEMARQWPVLEAVTLPPNPTTTTDPT